MTVTTRRQLVGVPVDAMTMAQTLAWVGDAIEAKRPSAHLCVNAANVAYAHECPAYRGLLNDADVVGADGASMLWAGRVLDAPLPERVTGIDLMTEICAQAPSKGWRIGLVGARADVVERVAANLRKDGVTVAHVRDGYFEAQNPDEIARAVAGSGVDVLFVGMPSPAKEEFIINHARPAGVPVTVGVGGAFDVLVGDLRRAPAVWQKLGIEWLYRLLQEPRRLFKRYAVTNTHFVLAVGREKLRPGRKSNAG